MSIGIIVMIIVAVAIVAALSIAAGPELRRRKLRQQFGPEYDRVAAERKSRKLAEAELTERERRVQKYQLRDLSDAARDKYETEWVDVQERFVDAPAEAVADAQRLVDSVMRDRGYPVCEYEQTIADLSVRHARTLDPFRSAHDIADRAASGQVATEELRIAILNFRELFSELLAGSSRPGKAAATGGPRIAAGNRGAEAGSLTPRPHH
jgi:hypothetical protein